MKVLSVPFALLALAASGAFAVEATQLDVPPPSALSAPPAAPALAERIGRGEASVFVDRMAASERSRDAVRAETAAALRRRGGPGVGYGEAVAFGAPGVM